jgi:hypothetical protein
MRSRFLPHGGVESFQSFDHLMSIFDIRFIFHFLFMQDNDMACVLKVQSKKNSV